MTVESIKQSSNPSPTADQINKSQKAPFDHLPTRHPQLSCITPRTIPKGTNIMLQNSLGAGQSFNLGSFMIVFFVAFSVIILDSIFLGPILFYRIEDDAGDALLRRRLRNSGLDQFAGRRRPLHNENGLIR